MSTEIMLDYVDKIIKPYIGENKCLLVLDDYKAHKTQDILDYFSKNNVQPFIIPGGFTYCLQPLDVIINKPIKDTLRRLWKHWNDASTRYTKKGNKSKPCWQQTISVVDASTKSIKTNHFKN